MNAINAIKINIDTSSYDADFIKDLLYYNNIAKAYKVILKDNTAYVIIDSWCDSETAYQLIQSLNKNSPNSKIVYNEHYWFVKKTTLDIVSEIIFNVLEDYIFEYDENDFQDFDFLYDYDPCDYGFLNKKKETDFEYMNEYIDYLLYG